MPAHFTQAHLKEGVAAATILLSASTYLFDFASNVVVVQEYSSRYIHALKRGTSTACDATCRLRNAYITAYFYWLLAILLFSHALIALIFKLRFTRHRTPFCTAYSLPLIHLYGLFTLLCRTLSCSGVQDLRSPEMNGLYSILGTALEGVPMLDLQFTAHLSLMRHGVLVHGMPTKFKVSVVASLISATYNGAASVQSVATNAVNLKENVIVGVIAGGFTLSATVLHSLTVIDILVYIDVYFSRRWPQQNHARFSASELIFFLVTVCTTSAYWLYYWLQSSPTNFAGCLHNPKIWLTTLALSYISLIVGPLYPMVSLANDTDKLGRCIFRRKLCMLGLLNLFLQLTFLIVAISMGTLPKAYLIVCLVAATFYLVFLCAYMKFDTYCGPTTSSQRAEMQTVQHEQTERVEPLLVQPGQTEHADAPFLEVTSECEPGNVASCPVLQSLGVNTHTDLSENRDIVACRSLHRQIDIGSTQPHSIRRAPLKTHSF